MTEESKQYTAFAVPNRKLSQFCPSLEPYVSVYLDNVIICTPSFGKHLETLDELLGRSRKTALTLGRDKCRFCKSELKCLRYVVNSNGFLVEPG